MKHFTKKALNRIKELIDYVETEDEDEDTKLITILLLLTFNEISNTLSCHCEENFTCSIHEDIKLSENAISEHEIDINLK